MEIDIQSKTNNPLLNRTEVYFLLHHEGESTPKRELVRSELADQLKVKRENIMINYMKANFGTTETVGYARIYKSVQAAKAGERTYILKRNNVIVKEKKPEKEEKTVEKPPSKPEEIPKKSEEESTKQTDEKIEERIEEKKEETKTEEKKSDQSDEEKVEKEKSPEKKE